MVRIICLKPHFNVNSGSMTTDPISGKEMRCYLLHSKQHILFDYAIGSILPASNFEVERKIRVEVLSKTFLPHHQKKAGSSFYHIEE